MRCRRNARQETNHREIAAVFCPGSLHRDAPYWRHLLSSSSSAYDQNQTSMIFLHSIRQSLVEDNELGQRVTTRERVTRG